MLLLHAAGWSRFSPRARRASSPVACWPPTGEAEGDLKSISTDEGEIVGQWGVAKEEFFTKIDIFSKC